ncbi:uncharacterized protein WM277_011974 [Molossus nigricans]
MHQLKAALAGSALLSSPAVALWEAASLACRLSLEYHNHPSRSFCPPSVFTPCGYRYTPIPPLSGSCSPLPGFTAPSCAFYNPSKPQCAQLQSGDDDTTDFKGLCEEHGAWHAMGSAEVGRHFTAPYLCGGTELTGQWLGLRTPTAPLMLPGNQPACGQASAPPALCASASSSSPPCHIGP